jgi:hypothetical protein
VGLPILFAKPCHANAAGNKSRLAAARKVRDAINPSFNSNIHSLKGEASMGLTDLFKQATGANFDGAGAFDQIAGSASREDVGAGVADALRSDQTPPLKDMVGQLFGQSSPGQQAGLLNQIIGALGPAVAGGLAGGALGRILQPGQQQVTPDQASQLSPEEAGAIAHQAQVHNPGVVDEIGRFYADHSGLIKTLGSAALMMVMAKMKNNQSNS